MNYRVDIESAARRSMRALSTPLARGIDQAILALGSNPRPPGHRRLKGMPDIYRIRIGDYRVIYRIRDDVLVVLVIRIGHRREVYSHL